MILRWIAIQAFYWLCVLVAMFLWPITYPIHKYVKSKWNPIYWIIHNSPNGHRWYWVKFGVLLDDPEPTGFKKFWISYNWSVIRNGCWRLYNTILLQRQGEKTDVEVIKNVSYDDKTYSPFTVLRMKFKTGGVPTDNVGTEFDYERTFQGKNYVKYRIGNRKYFMYSYCRIEGSKGRELTLGWSGKRPLIRNKYKNLK
jgi:hypothetical protein